jgi:hypothetical protein
MQFDINNSYSKVRDTVIMYRVTKTELKSAAPASDGRGERVFNSILPLDAKHISCSFCKMNGHTVNQCWSKHLYLRSNKDSHIFASKEIKRERRRQTKLI